MTTPRRDVIADELRQAIATGAYSPGDKLPTEAELTLELGVARETVRDALRLLVEEGLVERKVGPTGGTFVRRQLSIDVFAWRDDQPAHTGAEADLFFRTVREQGRTPRQDFEVRDDAMPAELAALLHVEPGSAAVVRRCVRYVDELPHSIQDSWYPDWLCERVPLLRSRENIVQGTTRLLADEGFVQRAAEGRSATIHLSAADAAILRVSPARDILRHVLTGYTEDGPLRISAASFAPGTRLVSRHGDVSIIERFRR